MNTICNSRAKRYDAPQPNTFSSLAKINVVPKWYSRLKMKQWSDFGTTKNTSLESVKTFWSEHYEEAELYAREPGFHANKINSTMQVDTSNA